MVLLRVTGFCAGDGAVNVYHNNNRQPAGQTTVFLFLTDYVYFLPYIIEGSIVMFNERITGDPAVMGGKPCIRGMRITVGTIVGLIASGKSNEQILEAYPYLEKEDIVAALHYAAWRVQEFEAPLSA